MDRFVLGTVYVMMAGMGKVIVYALTHIYLQHVGKKLRLRRLRVQQL